MSYARRGLHGQVVDDIGRRIVRGDLAPGTAVDLDALEGALGVSRTVVREAVKVLEAKGLLEARPKRGTVVRPRAAWNLLDPDVVGWCFEDGPDPRFLAALNELRQALEPAAARLAAARASPEDVAAMREALAALRADHGNIDASTEDDVALHRAILAASGNELLVRVGALIEAGLRGRDRLAFSYGWDTGYLDRHGEVVAAIAAGDGDRAETAMRHLVLDAAADTVRLLGTGDLA
jgi:GntR family transcriptional regulator, galactonate operon transcriptional repressor